MFTCYNGEFFPANDSIFKSNNRSFLYGDGVFESIRMIKGKILFLDQHLERLSTGMDLLHLKKHHDFSTGLLSEKIHLLDQKNNLNGNGRIRLNIFRSEGGLYTPEDNNISYLISATATEESKYSLNSTGLIIGLFDELKKPVNKLSSIKTCNALIFVLAGIWKNNKKFDDCVLINDFGRLCEGLSSNLFIVKNNRVTTPSLSEGCIKGVMRGQVIELILSAGYTISEENIEMEDLLDADEVFLTNASIGLQWVSGYKTKRYYSNFSKELVNLLNNLVDQN